MEVKDSNGNILNDGDSVTVIKDLKVRGSSDVIKRGTTVKNIKLTDDPAEIDCRVNKTAMVLRTEFVKKAQKKQNGLFCFLFFNPAAAQQLAMYKRYAPDCRL